MKKITTGAVLVGLACLSAAFGAGFAIYLRPASASRNSSGTYSLFTPGNPIVTGTTSNATTMNNTLSDIATSLTDSLDRNGKGGMLAALRGTDGTLAAPAFSWTSETGSGLFRNGAGDVRMSILGVLREAWSASGVSITGTGTFSQGLVSPLGIGNTSATYPLDIGAAVDTVVNARFLTSGAMPLFVYTAPTIATLGFNIRNDGTNAKYATSSGGAVLQGEPGTSAVVVYTTATGGTGGNTATLTERFRVNPSGATISTGVAADGSGFKHKRFGSLCSASAGIGSTCTNALTWTTPFADANYTVACTGDGITNVAVSGGITSRAAAGFTHQIVNLNASLSSTWTTLDCIAVHD